MNKIGATKWGWELGLSEYKSKYRLALCETCGKKAWRLVRPHGPPYWGYPAKICKKCRLQEEKRKRMWKKCSEAMERWRRKADL